MNHNNTSYTKHKANVRGLKRMRTRNVKYLHSAITQIAKQLRREALKVFYKTKKSNTKQKIHTNVIKIRALPLSGYVFWKLRIDNKIRL